MKLNKGEFPLQTKISFEKLVDTYRSQLGSKDKMTRMHAEEVLRVVEEHPVLIKGMTSEKELKKYKPQIDFILKDLFSEVLTKNEIKIATIPFNDITYKTSKRYDSIIENAGSDFTLEIINFDEDQYYIMGCSIILNQFYGYSLDFRRPFYYNIPDAKGMTRSYKILYNADYVEIEKTEKSKDISHEDVAELMDNVDNLALWKEKFPPESWILKGFAIANLFDMTTDVAISEFKSKLLQDKDDTGKLSQDFERIFKTIFNVEDLKIGFADHNEEDETFERLLFKDIKSYVLKDKKTQKCTTALCSASFYTLFKQNDFYTISNTLRYHEKYPENILYKKLIDQNINSAILAAIVHDGKVLGILELVSSKVNALNSINANKLKDIMPYLADSVRRSKDNTENELELIIQEECTSIHKSVHWKFRKEAKRVMFGISNQTPTYFREVVFEDVYPLYGQIDIKGSSDARNEATQKDLELQMEIIQKIIKRIHALEDLPIYEQMEYRIQEFLDDLKGELQVDSERQILNFLRKEILPLFNHLSKKSPSLKELIDEYNSQVEETTGLVYKHRKDYDTTVMEINKRMAAIIDRKQRDAQAMYPHYYERFKTDGVEHNLYIGESITKENSFHKVYLYNLRLWQLQVMCEMENQYYKIKKSLPIPLDVASMILSFNSPLALRFRMDEKRFDVDGTYNARYEVVKKRVDKANVKGTEERVTQPGKITIIYSQKEDEKEYTKYISFLQRKKYLDNDMEVVDLEDLQGVTGLKALRVSVLYSTHKDNSKEYYTYEDLMEHITS
ncbi:GAF domain-containing protein [Jejudonia soesokkakensis]|uniref:GAF domain-containing protein n=1 Tax=Jejudonia soesokkakensis TaxID=1323432 RepID=A0ABW2MRU7_9FLAO